MIFLLFGMVIKRGRKKPKAKSKGKTGKASKDLLLENFVLLQKTLVETVAALKEVNSRVSSMVDLFEEASRTFKAGKKPSTNILSRLETIEEQNQVIAKTLLLLQKQLKEKERYGITRAPELELEPSITTRKTRKKIKKKKKKIVEEEKKRGEPLFKEEFGAGEEEEEEVEEVGEEEEEGDEYRPKPLPEFSF